MKKYICLHLQLEHNQGVFDKVRWICKDCGARLTIQETQDWMNDKYDTDTSKNTNL